MKSLHFHKAICMSVLLALLIFTAMPAYALLDLQEFNSLQELRETIADYKANPSIVPDDDRGSFLSTTDHIYLPTPAIWEESDIKSISISLMDVVVYYNSEYIVEFGYNYEEEANKRFFLDAITEDELDIDRSRFNIDGRTIDYFYCLGESWYVWEQDGIYFYWRFQQVAPDEIHHETVVPWCNAIKVTLSDNDTKLDNIDRTSEVNPSEALSQKSSPMTEIHLN